MRTDEEYIKDLSDIRQMMERSTKFLSLAGWSGIMAGIYALAGAYIVYRISNFSTGLALNSAAPGDKISGSIILIALIVLFLAVATSVFLSYKKAQNNKETLWNATARRLIWNMAIPLISGGIFILILMAKGQFSLIIPFTLIFYGLALVNASKFTFDELRYMGIFEIMLGLLSAYFTGFSLIFWALGFGMLHIIYGIYMHRRYEK